MSDTTPITILVTGGRNFSHRTRLFDMLDRLSQKRPIALVVHGGATGADTLAGIYAEERNIPCRVYKPDRALDGPGRDWKFRRNLRMLHAAKPDLVVAFPGGPGTRHMRANSLKHGYPLWDLMSAWDTAIPLPDGKIR